jgi:hypothetical protein
VLHRQYASGASAFEEDLIVCLRSRSDPPQNLLPQRCHGDSARDSCPARHGSYAVSTVEQKGTVHIGIERGSVQIIQPGIEIGFRLL